MKKILLSGLLCGAVALAAAPEAKAATFTNFLIDDFEVAQNLSRTSVGTTGPSVVTGSTDSILGGTRATTLEVVTIGPTTPTANTSSITAGGGILNYSVGRGTDITSNFTYNAGGAGLGIPASTYVFRLDAGSRNLGAFANIPITVSLFDTATGPGNMAQATVQFSADNQLLEFFPANFSNYNTLTDIDRISLVINPSVNTQGGARTFNFNDFTAEKIPEPMAIIGTVAATLLGLAFSKKSGQKAIEE